MVDAVELVVTALAAGAAVGLTETATQAVKDSHAGLKAMAARLLRRTQPGTDGDDPSAGEAEADRLDELICDPAAHRRELVTALTSAGAGADTALVEEARKLLALVGLPDAAPAKYRIDVRDSQGVQVGDHNSMTLRLSK